MSAPILIPAIIVSVDGTNPGPASGISYTVKLTFPNTVTVVSGVKPHNMRRPDIVNTTAATPGSAIQAFEIDGQMQFFIIEGDDYTSCQ